MREGVLPGASVSSLQIVPDISRPLEAAPTSTHIAMNHPSPLGVMRVHVDLRLVGSIGDQRAHARTAVMTAETVLHWRRRNRLDRRCSSARTEDDGRCRRCRSDVGSSGRAMLVTSLHEPCYRQRTY